MTLTLQILNILVEENGKWRYVGTVTYNAVPKRVTGLIDRKRTQGMLKKAIIEDVKRQFLETKSPVITKTLSLDVNFVKP